MNKSLTIVITLCILLSLGIFLHTIDVHVVLHLVSLIGFKFSLLLLITFLAYILGTISWQYALGQHSKSVSTTRLFLIRHVGETVGIFNPASIIGGDALKAFILSRYDIPVKKIASSLLLSRTIMMGTQIMLFATTALALLSQHASLGGIYHSRQSGFFITLLGSFKGMRRKLSDLLTDIPEVIRENKKMLIYSCLFALLHWVVGGLEFYLILKFLGLEVSVLQALIVDLGVVIFKAAGAFIPGQLGVEEYGNKIMLMAIGHPLEETWVAASILRRGRQLFWIALGIAFYLICFRNMGLATKSSDGNIIYKS